MKIAVTNEVRLTSVKTIITKSEKEMTFVTIADKTTFEVLETRLQLAPGQTMVSIVEGRDYTAVVDYDGTYGAVTLTPVAQATSTGFGAKT